MTRESQEAIAERMLVALVESDMQRMTLSGAHEVWVEKGLALVAGGKES